MVSPSDVPRRRNGLSAPYSAPQVVSWLFLAATAIHFGLFITPNLPMEASIPLTAFFGLLVLAVIYFGLRAIAIDSIDIYLKKSLSEHRNGEIKSESKFLDRLYRLFNGDANSIKHEQVPDGEETKQCWICDTQVAEHSMHCKYCNKCVSHFDHHCLWLNTCIGEKNYPDFFRVMLSISLMQVVHIGISAGLVVDIFLKGPTKDRADDWLGADDGSLAVVIGLLVFVGFDVCSLILLAQLIAFHMHLQKERITTYQFIVKDAQKRREKHKMEMELHQQRVSELTRAEEEGRCWYAFRLKSGDQFRQWGCACMDPLEMPEPLPEPDPDAGFGSALGANPTNSTSTPEQPGGNGVAGPRHDDEPEPNENGISFLPTGIAANGDGMTNERHELDSQPSHSEMGEEPQDG